MSWHFLARRTGTMIRSKKKVQKDCKTEGIEGKAFIDD